VTRGTVVISDLCRCGAEFRIDAPSYTNPEEHHRVWLNLHAVCRTKAPAKKGS
jgi:hypothetical protein